jgi:hypothetical protein
VYGPSPTLRIGSLTFSNDCDMHTQWWLFTYCGVSVHELTGISVDDLSRILDRCDMWRFCARMQRYGADIDSEHSLELLRVVSGGSVGSVDTQNEDEMWRARRVREMVRMYKVILSLAGLSRFPLFRRDPATDVPQTPVPIDPVADVPDAAVPCDSVAELPSTAVLTNGMVPGGVVVHAPRDKVEPACIPSASWSHFTLRRSANTRENVLCDNAAGWYRVFDRGKGHRYRVFDRGKGMGAVSRDFFGSLSLTISILSSRVDTFFRASFGCSTYTCGCTCNT